MAKTKSVYIQAKEIFDEVNEDVINAVNESGRTVSKEASDKLQNTSPRRYGEYANGWKIEKHSEGYYEVYNVEGWKTQLLENGHIVKNKYGEYGRWNGIKHIKPVERWANNEYQRQIEDKLP